MIDCLQWLHISDLHFRTDVIEGDQFSQHVACKAIIEHLEETIPRLSPHFVLVTGDIANSGNSDQYEEARKFFDELSRVLSIPKELFFFVPGNHDVDRTINGLAYKGACEICNSQQDVDRVLGGNDFHTILERQQEFWSFVEGITGDQHRTYTQNKLAYLSQVSIDGLKINLLGINSAWLCGRDGEVAKLVIGERQVLDLIELSEHNESVLCLGLAHHPIEWLHQWDQLTCRKRLLPKIDFYHQGHLHQSDVYLSSAPNSPCISISAGSGHASRFYRNSYNLISLDLGTGECTISQFEYSVEQGQYKHNDNTTALLSLKGKMPCDMSTFHDVILKVIPDAHPYAGYMSGLLFGHFQEIPVKISGMMAMMAPDTVCDIPPEEALAFLTLRNRLRLYDDTTPLIECIHQHQTEIQKFAEYLKKVSAEDKEFSKQIIQKNTTGLHLMGSKPVRQHSYAIELLKDLQDNQDWPTLEVQARRYEKIQDQAVAMQSRLMLIEALIHSDQSEKRNEGISLAKEIIEQPTSGANEYLLAAGAAERVRDDSWALSLAKTMIEKWPDNIAVGNYVRSLALRLGNRELREAVDKLPAK